MLSPYTVIDLTDDRGELASMVLGDGGQRKLKWSHPMALPAAGLGLSWTMGLSWNVAFGTSLSTAINAASPWTYRWQKAAEP